MLVIVILCYISVLNVSFYFEPSHRKPRKQHSLWLDRGCLCPQTPNRSDTGEQELVRSPRRCCGCCNTYDRRRRTDWQTWFRTNFGGITRHRGAFTHLFRLEYLESRASSPMASPVADIGPSHQHHPATESAADSAFQEAQKWIEVSTTTDSKSSVNSEVLCFPFCCRCFVVIMWPTSAATSPFDFFFFASSPVERWLKLR